MRLKKLDLFGFKSFADRTTITFDNGVTCIVGPNGCGKSNISDAMRWVLGERSAKLLRGTKMEDVIFNGTDFRPALAFAEVALTIDNADRGLPIEYSEVTITRRLYRSGESEYYLNKTLCRLKDIQDLILDTGIGSKSYSMIEQGRIDYILRADAEERRYLIEEAAGIAKYKTKKDEAIRKLDRTEDNLKRLNDIIHEIQKNIQYAERQAKRAERYKKELESLKTLEIQYAFFLKNNLAHKKDLLEKKRDLLKSQIEAIEREIRNSQESLSLQEESYKKASDEYQTKEGERYKVLSKIEKNEQKIQFIHQSKLDLAQQKGQIIQEQEQLQKDITSSETQKFNLEKSIEEHKTKKEAVYAGLNKAKETLSGHEENLSKTKGLIEEARKDFFEAVQNATASRNELHRLRATIENIKKQQIKQESNATRYTEEVLSWKAKLDECLITLEGKNCKLEEYNKRHQELLNKKTDIFNNAEELSQNKHKTSLAISQRESRLKTLQEIEKNLEINFDEITQKSKEISSDFIQPFKEAIKIEEGYEWALDIVLGEHVHTLIIENASALKQILDSTQDKKPSTIGFFIKNRANLKGNADTFNPYAEHGFKQITDLITVHPDCKDIIFSVLGGVYIGEKFPLHNLESLLPLNSGHTLVSRDGILLKDNGCLFVWNNQKRSDLFFTRNKEISELKNEIADLDFKQTEFKKAEEFSVISKEQIESDLGHHEKERTQYLLDVESSEARKSNLEERLKSFHSEVDLAQLEINEAGKETLRLQEVYEKVRENLKHNEALESSRRQNQNEKEKHMEALSRERESFLLDVHKLESESSGWQNEFKHFEESLHMLSLHSQKDQDRLAFLVSGESRLSEKDIELSKEEGSGNEDAKRYENDLQKINLSLELARQKKQEEEEKISAIKSVLQESSRKQKTIEEEEHKISLESIDFSYQDKNIAERLEQKYRVNLGELNPEEYSLDSNDAPEITEKLEKMQSKVESLGTVNLLAIEEYDEFKQRYDFLMSQKKDLDDARETLMDVIRTVNRTTKKLFEETFQSVQEKFREYYQILFRGGDAKLMLIDESHPLDSGIDIIVRPPGKKLQHMSLLSGGEKALTAVALLFALFKIKPSPFCVLDEVDAPLDEANIDRFLTVLRSFVETSQFIIITHNRKTIVMGDSLYGVTMEEAGISKIVSVKVNAGEESTPDEIPEKQAEDIVKT